MWDVGGVREGAGPPPLLPERTGTAEATERGCNGKTRPRLQLRQCSSINKNQALAREVDCALKGWILAGTNHSSVQCFCWKRNFVSTGEVIEGLAVMRRAGEN